MGSRRWLLAATVLAATLGDPLFAQTARTGGAPNAQLLQQLQQLASERTAAQAENGRLKKELEDMRKERDSLKSSAQASTARSKASSAAIQHSDELRAAAEAELKQIKEKADQLIVQFRDTIQKLRETETERGTLRQTLATRDQELKTCIDRNLALYTINEEVLHRLDTESLWSRLGTAEPFTRLKRTQLENLVDDYKSKAEDQRVTAEALKAAAARQPPPAATAATPPSTATPGSAQPEPHQ
jgi:hypothetical protein